MPVSMYCEKPRSSARYCCSSLFRFIALRKLSRISQRRSLVLPITPSSSNCATPPGKFQTHSPSSRDHQAGFCNIDQPIIGRSLEPSANATSQVGYVRLHGRRYDTWFDDNPATPAHERYNYLYSGAELDPWTARIQTVREHTQDTYVITNNHYQGKAVVNALQLLSLLKGTKVRVPEPLRQHYPQLDQIADAMPAAPTLFPMGSRPPAKK